MSGTPLYQAIELLVRQAGINFILDPQIGTSSINASDLGSTPVNIRWENITPKDALARLLKEHGLVLVENPITSVARIAPASLNIKPIDSTKFGNDTNVVAPVIMMQDAPLDGAIQVFANEMHWKVAMDKAVSEWLSGRNSPSALVSFHWRNLTAKQALVALLDNYGLSMIEHPDSATLEIKLKSKD